MSSSGVGFLSNGAPPAIRVEDLHVAYQQSIQALRGITLEVPSGSVLAVLGANGAGKTTFLRTVGGLLGFHHGAITSGSYQLWGKSAEKLAPQSIVRRGVGQVLEGRRIFAEMTVDDNLNAGAISVRTSTRKKHQLLDQFPILAERRHDIAGYLSGGEQQMLAIARALMCEPKLILFDEPSLGLAPIITHEIADIISRIAQDGTTVLLVEQNATMALSLCDYAYIFQTGQVARFGKPAELLTDNSVQSLYLGGEAD